MRKVEERLKSFGCTHYQKPECLIFRLEMTYEVEIGYFSNLRVEISSSMFESTKRLIGSWQFSQIFFVECTHSTAYPQMTCLFLLSVFLVSSIEQLQGLCRGP